MAGNKNTMNSKLVIAIVIIILVIIAGFMYFNSQDSQANADSDSSNINSPNLESDDQVFSEIDNTLETIE